MKHRIGAKTGNLVRVLAGICILMFMLSTVFIGGKAYADEPCWKVTAGSMGKIDPPTLTYHEGAYYLSDSPFRYNGTNYNFGYYYYSGAMEYEGEGILPVVMGEPIMFVDGELNVDVGLYSALTPPPSMTVHMTIYYANGYKSSLEGIMNESMGVGNWSCDAYHEGVFVNESEEYVYHAPSPICETVPEPTLPPGDNVSEFIIPEYNESSAWIWSATAMNQTSGGEESCATWESIWANGWLMPGVHPYNIVASVSMMGTAAIGRNILAFNTSDIPDDAVITGAYLRVIPYEWMLIGNSEDIVVGGTHNISIFPMAYTGGEPVPVGNYSESEFYGDFGRLYVDDIPIGMMTPNYNESIYTDVWFNGSGLSYINPEGLTTLTLRTVGDMNYECPDGSLSGEELAIWAGNLSGEEASPSSELVVAWHSPTVEPIPPLKPTVSIMLEIVALIFVSGTTLALGALMTKVNGMSIATKTGIATSMAVLMVMAAIIIESLVVAFK